MFAAVCITLSVPRASTATDGALTMENDVDRVGSDYQKLPGLKDALSCRARCAGDARCKAFAWVRSNGDCYLKDPAPAPTPNAGLVSGVRSAVPQGDALTMENDVDRVGSDYQKLPGLKDALSCRARCAGDARCKAFAWVRSNGDCYLKDPAPAPTPNAGLVSGARSVGR
jgi:hypothetical protein